MGLSRSQFGRNPIGRLLDHLVRPREGLSPGSAMSRLQWLQQLDQVPFGVPQGRDPHVGVVRRILDELDPGTLQSLPVRPDVVGPEGYHVPRRVAVASVHLAVRPQRERRRSQIAEHDEPRALEAHLEAEDVAIEGQQVLHVFAPDARPTQSLDHGHNSFRRRVTQPPIVFRMLPECSSMWPRRARLTISSALMGGIPVNTVPLFASSASERPRTTAAAAAAPFLWSASVSGLVQPANSLACRAFISSSIWGVKCGSAWPAAIVLMMWVTGSMFPSPRPGLAPTRT